MGIKINKIDDTTTKILLAVVLIAFAITLRLAPLPHNFAPIAAVAIFGGAILPRRWALTLPLVAMVVTDAVLGFHSLMWVVYATFVAIAFASNLGIKKIGVSNIIGGSMAASVFFFVTTNFAVWAEGPLYPGTFEGLMSSYFNALPFFRNTLLGDLVFSAALFGSYALVYRHVLNGKKALKIAEITR